MLTAFLRAILLVAFQVVQLAMLIMIAVGSLHLKGVYVLRIGALSVSKAMIVA